MKKWAWALVVVVLLGLAAACWAIPAERQTLQVDSEQVLIIRDSYGVPHIFADSERALCYGSGYAVAQDRLGQMEKYRRAARGTLAELVGSESVAHDQQVRQEGYTDAEYQEQVDRLDARYRAMLQAYADGVNAWMAEAKASGQLPALIKAAGIELEPWRPTDTAAIGAMMARRFGSGGGQELRVQQVYNGLKTRFGPDRAAAIFNDVAIAQDPYAPTTIPRGECEGAIPFYQPQAPAPRQALGSSEGLERAYAAMDWTRHAPMLAAHGITVRLGSYAWAVSPRRTASKAAMLVGGPQMGFDTPQIAHEVHLCGAGYNTMGMGFAGVPGVMIGINEHLAWTTTTAGSDVEDIFAEKLNPQDKYQYLHNGKWLDMTSRTELIKVRGQDPVTITVYRTVHGPVMS